MDGLPGCDGRLVISTGGCGDMRPKDPFAGNGGKGGTSGRSMVSCEGRSGLCGTPGEPLPLIALLPFSALSPLLLFLHKFLILLTDINVPRFDFAGATTEGPESSSATESTENRLVVPERALPFCCGAFRPLLFSPSPREMEALPCVVVSHPTGSEIVGGTSGVDDAKRPKGSGDNGITGLCANGFRKKACSSSSFFRRWVVSEETSSSEVRGLYERGAPVVTPFRVS